MAAAEYRVSTTGSSLAACKKYEICCFGSVSHVVYVISDQLVSAVGSSALFIPVEQNGRV